MAQPKYDAEKIKAAICERIAIGEPLRVICRDDGMPMFCTVYDWINKDADFAKRMETARLIGAEAIADDILEIADDARNDWMERRTQNGTETVADTEHIQRSKLRIETRLKLLAKWHPKKYGDRTVIAGDPDHPLQVESIERVIVDPKGQA